MVIREHQKLQDTKKTRRRDISDSEPRYQEIPLEKELRINRRNKPPFRAAFPIDHLALEEDCAVLKNVYATIFLIHDFHEERKKTFDDLLLLQYAESL